MVTGSLTVADRVRPWRFSTRLRCAGIKVQQEQAALKALSIGAQRRTDRVGPPAWRFSTRLCAGCRASEGGDDDSRGEARTHVADGSSMGADALRLRLAVDERFDRPVKVQHPQAAVDGQTHLSNWNWLRPTVPTRSSSLT